MCQFLNAKKMELIPKYANVQESQEEETKPSQITKARDTEQVSIPAVAPQSNVKTIKHSGRFVAILISFLVSLFLANQGGCYISAPAKRATARDSQLVDYHWNCGLNVGYVTLRLFRRDVNIYKLAEEIKAGERLERNVSLLDLKKAFEKRGLIAEGFKADYPEEIIEFAQPDSVLIVRVDSHIGDQSIGHFIVIKGNRDHVIVIDPPYHPKKFTRQSIIEDGVLSRTSREFLVVY